MLNLGTIDRVIRLIVGLLLVEGGYFWLGGGLQVLLIALGLILVATAAIGFCPLMRLFRFSTLRENARPMKGWGWISLGLVVLIVFVGGSYASVFMTKKLYLEDFNQMNNFYKQALYQTGQNNRDQAIDNYDKLVMEYSDFMDKYLGYHPYVLKGDEQFTADLQRVSKMIGGVADQVHDGDLQQAHLALEQVRPIFQEIFKRSGFSMLAVALVDFHDVMEMVLDAANAKNAGHVGVSYADADVKLNAIEAEANDVEIQAIRQNLEKVRQLAEEGQLEELPAAANTLKSSFVKVYLKRG